MVVVAQFAIDRFAIYDCARSWSGDDALVVARCTASCPFSRDAEYPPNAVSRVAVARGVRRRHSRFALPTTIYQLSKRKGFRFFCRASALPTTHYQLPTEITNRSIANKAFRAFSVFRGYSPPTPLSQSGKDSDSPLPRTHPTIYNRKSTNRN